MKEAHLKAAFVGLLAFPILFVACFFGNLFATGLVLGILRLHTRLFGMLRLHPAVLSSIGLAWGAASIVIAALFSWQMYQRVLMYFETRPSLFPER